ncbi:MAG: glycosyltransferase family 39 protein, partial [Phycisphaerae bacterium]
MARTMPAEPTPTFASASPPPRGWMPARPALILTLAAVFAQAAALAVVHRQRGSVTAYCFQSPDAGEYVALARGLAWTGRYVQISSAGQPLSGPDTWRTPGYPLFLAVVMRIVGDRPAGLLLAQQLLAVAAVPLLWLILRRVTAPRWAFLAALAFCFDPFRLYYALWLMSETLFTAVLILACLLWLRFRRPCAAVPAQDRLGPHEAEGSKNQDPRFPIAAPFLLGFLSAALVLIRPIALPLPILVVVGMILVSLIPRRRNQPPGPDPPSAIRRVGPAVACLLGVAVTLWPWLLRNHRLTGHVALSQQSGASLAYHKVLDVILWSEGRARDRFDPAVAAEVRSRIDRRLREAWRRRVGPLTAEQEASLDWHALNFGGRLADGLDPFVASRLLWSIGLETLADHPWAAMKCLTVQGLLMLIFPLGLVLWSPAGAGAAPLST